VFELRLAREPELETLAAWEADNTQGARWGLNQISEEFILPSSEVWVAQQGLELLGYAVLRRFPDGYELFNVLVPASARRRGVASALMARLHERVGEQPIWLEVRSSNEAAQALYVGLGYEQIGVRTGYYRDGEDAVLMSREPAPY